MNLLCLPQRSTGHGPNLPLHLLLYSLWAMKISTFFNGWQNQKKNSISWHMNILWNTSFSIHKQSYVGTQTRSLMVYDCFPATAAELSNCDRGCTACKAWDIYQLVLYRKVDQPGPHHQLLKAPANNNGNLLMLLKHVRISKALPHASFLPQPWTILDRAGAFTD